MDGRIVHRWHLPGFRLFQVRLLPTGNLLALGTDATLPAPPLTPFDQPPPPFAQHIRRIGGAASHLREVDWHADPVWEYHNDTLHHDFVRLENGHTLVALFVELPAALADQVQGGARRAGEQFPPLISDDIVEIDPSGKEVQRIHLWQLLDPAEDPICPLEQRWEWTHLNSLDVLPNGDLVFSCRNNSRVGIITRPAGQLRWKFGAPQVVHQHHATALRNGNIQIFDNGMHRVGLPFSRVVEVNPADNALVWTYTADPPEQFFSGHISSAERLCNGNVLICEGASGRVFEVTQRQEIVWEWVSPFVTNILGSQRTWLFRAYRYGPDFAGLRGRTLNAEAYTALNRLHGL
jgi:hypothetical protein